MDNDQAPSGVLRWLALLAFMAFLYATKTTLQGLGWL
jgi:hypothetical protein